LDDRSCWNDQTHRCGFILCRTAGYRKASFVIAAIINAKATGTRLAQQTILLNILKPPTAEKVIPFRILIHHCRDGSIGFFASSVDTDRRRNRLRHLWCRLPLRLLTHHRVHIALGPDTIQPHFAILIQFRLHVTFTGTGALKIVTSHGGTADLIDGASHGVFADDAFAAVSRLVGIDLIAELAVGTIVVGGALIVIVAAVVDIAVDVIVAGIIGCCCRRCRRAGSHNDRWRSRSDHIIVG